MRKTLILFFLLIGINSFGQEVLHLEGVVSDSKGEGLIGVQIFSPLQGIGCISSENGRYKLESSGFEANSIIEISYLGYHSQSLRFDTLVANTKIVLQQDRLGLEEVVVSANRSALKAYKAPILVNRINNRLLKDVQALSLAEGLSFSPGLRVENNCQSCGFTQLRINGLDGSYSQVLVNSRPIFSSLMGVYGLEMFPPSMIERVEVIKGGGSALYGGSAIAGTLNIITKEASDQSLNLSSKLKLIGGSSLEQNQQMSASVVNDTYSSGAYLFAFRRKRDAFDANKDGFSEMPQLENTTAGIDAYWKPASRKKLRFNLFWMNEDRRGGSDFHLLPHQSRVAEDLKHNVLSGGLSYEWASADLKQIASVYSAYQQVMRDSYYGAGGRVIKEGDSLSGTDLLALNAYGNSEDYNFVNGFQYSYAFNPLVNLSIGAEQKSNSIIDQMPGYSRSISQSIHSLGSFMQVQWQPSSNLEMLLGARYDHLQLSSIYLFNEDDYSTDQNFNIPSPRLSIKYDPSAKSSIRLSYARGFRAPQAFNEDLHIETVGGAALFIILDPNLKTEFSNSFSASYSFQKEGNGNEQQFVVESFYTLLINPFIISEQRELSNGTAIATKRNGNGATVFGLNLEYNFAYADWLVIRSGLTLQRNLYNEAELIWRNPDIPSEELRSSELLRSPELYGFLYLNYILSPRLELNVSLSYSGPMLVPHVVDPNNERTEIMRSPDFFDFGLVLDYQLYNKKDWQVKMNVGVQNIFNAYQQDFDFGAERDASYIYGPLQPRSIVLGLNFKLQ
jgi:outer membrane receptor for ferrienterochelin and colicins